MQFRLTFQPETLKFHQIDRFDKWISTFAEQTTNVESDINSKLRTMTRFSKFHNLGELMSLFCQVCSFDSSANAVANLPRFKGAVDICVPRNEAQARYMGVLSDRVDNVRNRKVRRTEDNMLKITGDGKRRDLTSALLTFLL